MRATLLLLGLILSSSCLAEAEPLAEELAADPVLSQAASAIVSDPRPSPTPMPRYAELWSHATALPIWPRHITHVQLIIRRAYAATSSSPASFYGFLVGNGSQLLRMFLVSNGDYTSFMTYMNVFFDLSEAPGSQRYHSIAGGLYVGPHPVGPPGDPVPSWYLDQILAAAALLD